MGSAARMGLLGGERRAMKSPLGWCDGGWLAAGERRAMNSPAYGAAPDESGLGCCNGERCAVQTSGR